LQPAQFLVQQKGTDSHVAERHQKISQAGLDDVAGVDRPDIDAPVESQQHAGEEVETDSAGVR
jgi:hypothetical protein